jgi:AcrR family transcriptional regulator
LPPSGSTSHAHSARFQSGTDFPGKAELGAALIGRYAARVADALERIDARGGDAPAKLAAYARIFADVLRNKRMCLCGMLAADYDTCRNRCATLCSGSSTTTRR